MLAAASVMEHTDGGSAGLSQTADPAPNAIVFPGFTASTQDLHTKDPHSSGLRTLTPDLYTHGLNSRGRFLNGLDPSGFNSRGPYTPNPPAQDPPTPCVLRPGGFFPSSGLSPINSRRKTKRFVTIPPLSDEAEPTYEYVQPSRVQYTNSYPGTPAYSRRTNRRTLINAQSPKTEVTRNGASRRERLRPYTLEPPPHAQRFPKSVVCSPAHAVGYSARARLLGSTSECCDFFPWKGNHKEDRVTDIQARNGLYDKLLVGKHNTEQASARASLAPYFRQRTGLQTLSALYLTIMTKRQVYSTVVIPSTFKPPPRVTLPENKRQAWLRDLANPAIPLRKLSRTIPHGLKGPSLLDQCASKKIPTSRAVWFVRCVGANELRGLRRRGVGSLAVGGEAKWIREWTVQVTQFLEKTIGACDVIDDNLWRPRMVYSIRLVVHLYAELLLDRALFLEWFLSFFASCSLDVLPLAFPIATAFWDDLMKLRRFAKRFAEILLVKAEEAEARRFDESYMIPLLRRLSVMASNILLSHRESIIGSNRLRGVPALVDCSISGIDECLRNVTLRNRYFDGLEKLPATASGRQKAVVFLDNIKTPFDTHAIYTHLVALLSSTELVPFILEWAVTPLRTGTHRVHIAANLLRFASTDGVQIQIAIQEFLLKLDVHTKVKKYDVYLLVAELVRTGYFSVAFYMRWLIAKGGLSKVAVLDESCPCYLRLLAEIPVHLTAPPLRNLRRILLSERSFDCQEEDDAAAEVMEIISSRGVFQMSGLLQNGHRGSRYMTLKPNELKKIRGLTRASKSVVGMWIKSNLLMLVTEQQRYARDSWRGKVSAIEPSVNVLSTAQVAFIRQVLEEIGDIAVLVEVIHILVGSDNAAILAMTAETINFNLEAISALHPVEDLERKLFQGFKKLQSRRAPTNRHFLASFLELLSVTGTEGGMRFDLQHALASYDVQHPRATVEQSLESGFMDIGMADDEEIDRLWKSRAVIDKPNMSRIFETTVFSLEASFSDPEKQQLHICSATRGLLKLRSFDASFFDELLRRWITRMKTCHNRIPLFRALSSMVAGSCLRIEMLVGIALTMLLQKRDESVNAFDAGMFLAMVLELIVHENPFATLLSAQDMYTLKRRRKSFIATSAHLLLAMFRDVIVLCTTSQSEELHRYTLRLLSSVSSLEVLRKLVVQKPDLLRTQLVEPLLQPTHLWWLQLLLDNLLDDNDCNDDNAEVDAHVQVGRLLDLANDFSIGLCKLKLRIILKAELIDSTSFGGPDLKSGARVSNTIARPFIRGIASASSSRRRTCTELVTVLDKDRAAQIRADVEELFLDWRTFFCTPRLVETLDLPLAHTHATGESLAHAFLSIVQSTVSCKAVEREYMSSLLIERMYKLLLILSSTRDEDTLGVSWWNHESYGEFRCWFVLFMTFLTIHRVSFVPGKVTSSTDQARMLRKLCILLKHEVIRKDEAYFELVLSLAESFCDGLPEETRLQLKRENKGKRVPMSSFLTGADEGAETLKALQRGRLTEFSVKPWERLAEPTPNIGENDVSISLVLFRTRRF